MGKQNRLSLRSYDVGLAKDGEDSDKRLKAERRNGGAFVGRVRIRLEMKAVWRGCTVNRQVEVYRNLGRLESR
jgi:hypothetical protein